MALGRQRYDDAGLFEHLRSLGSAIAQYFRARLQLAGVESKEAFVHYLKIAAFLAGAALLTLFGYVFLIVGVVFTVEFLFHVRWIWVMLAVGFLHVAGAVVCVLIAKSRFATPVFDSTITEFKKDQEWLSSPQ